MPEKPTRRPAPPAVEPKPEVVEATPKRVECNVPGCSADPELRGLCPAHRQTHRGLFDPASKESGSD